MEKLNSSQPLVTIALPCYNHSNFIKNAIKSLINQSYSNIELIIVDDGSTDTSVDEIKSLVTECKERFVRFEFRYRENKGLSNTLNETLEWAQGSFWTTCSSDDFYHVDKVKSQVRFFSDNDNYNFCLTKAYVISDEDDIIQVQTNSYNFGLNNKITFEDILTFKIHLPVTGMYKTEFIKKQLKGFDPLAIAEDYDINLKLVSRTKVGIIDHKLYYYRSPGAVQSSRKKRPMRVDVSESHLRTINKYSTHRLYSKAITEWNFRRFMLFSAYADTKIYAFKGLRKSLKRVNNINFYKALFRLIFVWKK